MIKIEDYPLLAKELENIKFVLRLKLRGKSLYVSEASLTSESRRAIAIPCDYKGLSIDEAYKNVGKIAYNWFWAFSPEDFEIEGSLE
jgi:hypothetical protein